MRVAAAAALLLFVLAPDGSATTRQALQTIDVPSSAGAAVKAGTIMYGPRHDRAITSLRVARQRIVVHYSFDATAIRERYEVGGKQVTKDVNYTGSGKLTFVEPVSTLFDNTVLDSPESVHGTATADAPGVLGKATLFSGGYKYSFVSGHLVQELHLDMRVEGGDCSSNVRDVLLIYLKTSEANPADNSVRVAWAPGSGGYISSNCVVFGGVTGLEVIDHGSVMNHQAELPLLKITRSPPPASPNLLPTKLTLTVNGWTLTATKAKPAVYLHHETDEPLASETQLKIRATIDHPLPKGWKLTVYHNGDVLSQGNGVWHKVCEVVGPSTTITCGDTRPGRVGPFDDSVWAAVTAPTYLAMHSDIYFHFNTP